MTSANERERKSATVRARIEPSLKEAAERILDGIGLDPTTVVTALYRQIVARNGMPFEFELTDGKSRKSVQAARRGRGDGCLLVARSLTHKAAGSDRNDTRLRLGWGLRRLLRLLRR